MTEITRVPLQPLAKGSISKLWLGIAAALAAAGGLAWATMPQQVTVETVRAGQGASPGLDDVALINYKGTLPDGKVFDEGQTPMPVRGTIPGFAKGLQKMQTGGKYKLHIPSALAYGAKGQGPIPPDTDLDFDVELLGFMPMAQFQQQMQAMQAMQQQQGGQGAPGGPPMPPPARRPR